MVIKKYLDLSIVYNLIEFKMNIKLHCIVITRYKKKKIGMTH